MNLDGIILGDDPSQTAPLCNGTAKEIIAYAKSLESALLKIIDEPICTPSDSKALKEMVKIAKAALPHVKHNRVYRICSNPRCSDWRPDVDAFYDICPKCGSTTMLVG